MDFFRFLISKTFLRHLLLAAAIALIIILVTLVWLRIYTHHGQTISVPNLTGLTFDEAGDVVSSRKLNIEVLDSIYAMDMPRGTVVKQTPPPNSKVKVRRRVFVTMNAVNPEKVSMPDLVSLSDRQAILALENAGLELGEISYKPDFAVNSVLQQKIDGSVIEEGTQIEKGSRIDLVLGMGLSSENTVVPDLQGLDLAKAKAAISNRFLNFGLATYDQSVKNKEDSLNAWVYRQNPDYDGFSAVNKGMEVFVWLTVDSTLLPVTDTIRADLNKDADAENEIIF
ncbi:MAG: PASTA domain-containing protein [Bacteroidales bacterium]